MSFPIKHLTYQKIGQIADEFLAKYHPKLLLPIPIEEIAENKLNLKILEEMDLKKNYDVDGFLTSDLENIFIDFNLYMNFENRTKFTIAHELGHFVLHGELFKKLSINSVETLNTLTSKITDEEYSWLEYQAYSFASQVLVPKKALFEEIVKRLGKIPQLETPEVLATIAQDLLDVFQVSGEVILRRLQKEGIVKSNS
ncbi:ImmA/IrrE family metallo-endopeptidase [Candidatus Daviesbacteria bacterium]|nr:ImmA/IrrE family metallo-endopeptidase [Candidatus Daviesbacteria bacterium]MBI2596728.1 ImmA/IrrE family metallo-endopeptidase [Candidatus Daviesbacteria bacterium]